MLAVGAVSALGPNPLISKVWAAGENPEQWIQSGSHFGAFEAKVVNGEWVDTRPFKHDKYPCDMLNAVREVVYNPSRVRYPMVRLDWLKKREKSDTTQRGDNRFVRVTWDQALDLFYGELERIQKQHGPWALHTGLVGWRQTGQFHSCGNHMLRAIGMHGLSVSTSGDYSTGAGQVILPYVLGSTEVYSQGTSWEVILKNSNTVIFWASDPVKNLQVGWNCETHEAYDYLAQLKSKIAARQIKVISIDPVKSKTQNYLGCERQYCRGASTCAPSAAAACHGQWGLYKMPRARATMSARPWATMSSACWASVISPTAMVGKPVSLRTCSAR